MKKIPCLFRRNFGHGGDFTIRPDVTPGCEWVLAGEGTATRKRDGTAIAVIDGNLFKRHDAKGGKAPPPGFIPADEPDPVTGHHPGWVLVTEDDNSNRWILEADRNHGNRLAEPWWPPVNGVWLRPAGTYELVGPKVQAGAEGEPLHRFIMHGTEALDGVPRDFAGLREYLRAASIEGIVFHHHDGRMVKIRRDDFGFGWGSKKPRDRGAAATAEGT